MITLITGAPGSGKTLYVVTELLKPLIGTTVWGEDDDGNQKEYERRVFTNINQFVLDHQYIEKEGDNSIRDYFKWAKPGDFICYDEIQKSWKKRPTGSHVPDYIEHLETHRHEGIELVLMTQGTGLIDQNLIPLVGRHLHVRRFGFLPFSMIYEWDHCSRALLYSKAVKKKGWIFKFWGYKLYKSSKLHIKPKSSIPTLAFVVLLALGAAAYFIPSIVQRISSKNDPKTATAPQNKAPAPNPLLPAPPPSVAPVGPSAVPSMPPAPPVPGTGFKPMTSSGQRGQPYDVAAFLPVVSYDPRSAPLYDHLREVVTMPRIVGRICPEDEPCYCMTQQRTAVPQQLCDEWDDWRRRRFDPFKPDPGQAVAALDQTPAAMTFSPAQ